MIVTLVAALLASGLPCNSAEASSKVTLVAQAVDPLWLPVPGTKITAKGGAFRQSYDLVTDMQGFACFAVPKGEYSLRAQLSGFKVKAIDGIVLRADILDAVPYVQLKMDLVIIDRP